jgi:hypothetical protein
MLPALWSALCQMYHGDLSESNLLIKADYSRFHLIDPGVQITNAILSSTDSWAIRDDRCYSVFTTTPVNYPLLPPFDAPYLEINASKYQSLDLQGYLNVLSDRNSYVSTLGASAYGMFSFKSRQMDHALRSTQRRSRPLPSDLLALGLIYYRILTDEELLFGQAILPEGPAWLGELPSAAYFPRCQDGSIFAAYVRVANILAENYIARALDKHPLSRVEKQLVSALLNLQVRDQTHLNELTQLIS